jgi:adenylate cyclase
VVAVPLSVLVPVKQRQSLTVDLDMPCAKVQYTESPERRDDRAADPTAPVKEWRHDPGRRGNVPYRDAAVRAMFGSGTPAANFNPAFRGRCVYVEERLAGTVAAPNGAIVARPMVSWSGRRHGQRKARRWSTAWSPEQIARRLGRHRGAVPERRARRRMRRRHSEEHGVREAIFRKLGLPLRDLGEKTLKNIDRPAHIYQIQSPGTRARHDWLSSGLRQYRRLAPALGLAVLIAAVAGIGAWRFWPRETLMPDYTPVIAVLPFTSAGGDAGLEHLGTSFAREVSSVLSTFPLWRIVSASGLAPEKLLNARQAAQDLGARFALDGDFSQTSGHTRIRVQLTDAQSGETVWSDSYEFEGEDQVAIQEKTAERLYGVIGGNGGKVRKIEEEAAWRKPESALTDYDYYLRSQTFFLRYTPDDNLRARKILEDGLARFPDSPLLRIRLAWTYNIDNVLYVPFENCHESAETAYRLGHEAEDAKNKSRFIIYSTRYLMVDGYAWYGENFDRSIQEAEAAAEMSPYDAGAKGVLAYRLVNAGKLDEAIEWASWALAHDVQKSPFPRNNLAWAYYVAGRYEEALEIFKPLGDSYNPAQGAVHYASVARLDEAKAEVDAYLKAGHHSIKTESCAPMREPLKQKYLSDLRKAGLPEK